MSLRVYSCSEPMIASLKLHWADRSGYFVGGNMVVHYDPSNKRCLRGLDFFLVLDVEDRERKSWVVAGRDAFPRCHHRTPLRHHTRGG